MPGEKHDAACCLRVGWLMGKENFLHQLLYSSLDKLCCRLAAHAVTSPEAPSAALLVSVSVMWYRSKRIRHMFKRTCSLWQTLPGQGLEIRSEWHLEATDVDRLDEPAENSHASVPSSPFASVKNLLSCKSSMGQATAYIMS